MSKQLALSAFFSVLAMGSLALSTGQSHSPFSNNPASYLQAGAAWQILEQAPGLTLGIAAQRLLPR